MGDTEYRELFVTQFSGNVLDLLSKIRDLEGVNSARTPENRVEVNTELNIEISYDSYLTDRSQVAERVEGLPGVTEVTIG